MLNYALVRVKSSKYLLLSMNSDWSLSHCYTANYIAIIHSSAPNHQNVMQNPDPNPKPNLNPTLPFSFNLGLNHPKRPLKMWGPDVLISHKRPHFSSEMHGALHISYLVNTHHTTIHTHTHWPFVALVWSSEGIRWNVERWKWGEIWNKDEKQTLWINNMEDRQRHNSTMVCFANR